MEMLLELTAVFVKFKALRNIDTTKGIYKRALFYDNMAESYLEVILLPR